MIPISEAIKYPVGTRFRLESLAAHSLRTATGNNWIGLEFETTDSVGAQFFSPVFGYVWIKPTDDATTFTLIKD